MRVAEGTRRAADHEPRLGQAFDLQGELDAKTTELSAIDIALAETQESTETEEDEFAHIFGPIGRAGAIEDDDTASDTDGETAE